MPASAHVGHHRPHRLPSTALGLDSWHPDAEAMGLTIPLVNKLWPGSPKYSLAGQPLHCPACMMVAHQMVCCQLSQKLHQMVCCKLSQKL